MQHDSDNFAALDRAWEMYLEGDLDGALDLAVKTLDADAGSPEAHTLVGTIKVSLGLAEEALDHFESAIASDELFFEAFLNAGDVLMQLGRAEEAMTRLESAEELASDPDAVAEVLLLQVDALFSLGKTNEAKAALAKMPSGPFEGPHIEFLTGRALLQTGDFERANAMLEAALAVGVEDPDLHYYVAMGREAVRDFGGATVAFLQCRERDMRSVRAPWSEPLGAFEKRVQARIRALPARLSNELEGALVIVEEFPGVEMVSEGLDPRAPAMLDEIRLRDTEQTLRRLFIYQRNIDRFVPGRNGVDAEIARVLETEIDAFLKAPPPPARNEARS